MVTAGFQERATRFHALQAMRSGERFQRVVLSARLDLQTWRQIELVKREVIRGLSLNLHRIHDFHRKILKIESHDRPIPCQRS